MFEGTLRWTASSPAVWWLVWLSLGFLAGGLRWSGRGFERRLLWAWTDVRLLFQELGDGMEWRVQDVLIHAGAGMAAALSITALWAHSEEAPMNGELFLRLWGTWFLISGMRGGVGYLMGRITGRSAEGVVWSRHHRWLQDSAGWAMAPVALLGLAMGPHGAGVALVLCGAIWGAGWTLRQWRALFDNRVFRAGSLVPILYLCALEILPTAVLLRAWQG